MKVSIVVSPKGQESKALMDVGRALATTLEKRGYSSELLNTSIDTDKKLILSDYLIIVAEPLSFFSSKLSPKLSKYLENAGTISGKRGSTILLGNTLFKTKAMSSLMNIVEGQGVILKTSQFVKNPSQAVSFANTINVERNY